MNLSITALDKDVIGFHIGRDYWAAFQGLDLDADYVAEMFRHALEVEAFTYEPTDADRAAFAAQPTLTYETIPQVRQVACERVAAALRVLVGFAEVQS